MERNVFCVKWGTKYSADDVNRLYRMVERNITGSFKFYCFTEDQKDLYPQVNVIPLDDSLQLERYWWKLTMFKDNIVDGDVILYFDLDVVIQNNIDHLFNAHSTKLTLIDNSLFDMPDGSEVLFEQGSYTYYNSSIMCWKNNTQQHIFDKFIERMNFWMNVYIGIDRFMFNEIDSKCFKGWDKKVFYFRLKNQPEGEPTGKVKHPDQEYWPGSMGVWYFPDYTVCVFNQAHYPEFYKGFEKYFL